MPPGMDLVTVVSVCTSGSGRSSRRAETTTTGPYLSTSSPANNGPTIASRHLGKTALSFC